MADISDDASGVDDKSNLSAAERMADIKSTLDSKAGGDSSEYASDEEEAPVIEPNAEAGDAPDGDDGNGEGDGDGSGNESDPDDNPDDAPAAGSDKGKQESEVRFTQFKGDGKPETYLENLEKGYLNSSEEGIKLNEQVETISGERDELQRQVDAVKAAAASDPEFGQKLLGLLKDVNSGAAGDGDQGGAAKPPTQSDDPFLVDARTKWEQESAKSARAFIDANPEVVTDKELNSEVKRLMRMFSNDHFKTHKVMMTSGEAMDKAYAYLGRENRLKSDSGQDLIDGMKQNAAPTRPQATKKKSSGKDAKQFSNLTLDIASKMGMSQERLKKGSRK